MTARDDVKAGMSVVKMLALPFALLACSNALKPTEASAELGFIFMGHRLSGIPNAIAAWSFAVYLAAYAHALWRERPHALPLGIAYACYVTINMAFFQLRTAPGESNSLFGLAYVALALSISWGTVALLAQAGYAERQGAEGRLLLRSFALLFGLMALSNLLKIFVFGPSTGFVLFGARLAGNANILASLGFSAFLAAYAFAIWTERKPAVAMGTAYALYVIANLVLWNFRKPPGAGLPVLFSIGYLISAVGVSSGAAILLNRYRDRFGVPPRGAAD